MRLRHAIIIALFPLLLGISAPKGPTDLGNEAFKAKKYEEALGHYMDAVKADPDSPQTHYNLGNAYYRLGNFEAARSEYTRAAELDPNMADAYYNSGDAGFRLNDFEGALNDYEHADKIRPDDADTLFNIELTKKIIELLKKSKGGDKKGGGKGDKTGKKQDEKGGDGGVGVGRREVEKLSRDAVESMLDRQEREDRELRGYFRPGQTQRAPGAHGKPRKTKKQPEKDW